MTLRLALHKCLLFALPFVKARSCGERGTFVATCSQLLRSCRCYCATAGRLLYLMLVPGTVLKSCGFKAQLQSCSFLIPGFDKSRTVHGNLKLKVRRYVFMLNLMNMRQLLS